MQDEKGRRWATAKQNIYGGRAEESSYNVILTLPGFTALEAAVTASASRVYNVGGGRLVGEYTQRKSVRETQVVVMR